MEQETVLEAFKNLCYADYPDRDEDLESYVRASGNVGIAIVIENLKVGRYIRDSIFLCHRLELREAIPLIKPYLNSDDQMVKTWASIALSKMNDRDGLSALKQMIESGEFPKHWLEWLKANEINVAVI